VNLAENLAGNMNWPPLHQVRWENRRMQSKKNIKKSRYASDKAIAASVTKEMARPRVTQSVQAETDAEERVKARRGKLAGPRPEVVSGRAAKAHIEQYGTGTPMLRTKR
jgi:hypothetical protein